jgi:hypothetical protein
VHVGGANRDISVVGDVTRKLAAAAGAKPVWMTLQIAWSGILPSKQHPGIVPRFPTFEEERFMAYQAIADGARGLAFFGGHLTQVARPADAQAGWNWTFWELVLRPLLIELTSTAVQPALIAPTAKATVIATAADVNLVAREDADFFYLIAVRRGGRTSTVGFSGLPRRRNGIRITGSQVLFEYVQEPPPPPILPHHHQFRSIPGANGAFRNWFGPHDAHVYRFPPPIGRGPAFPRVLQARPSAARFYVGSAREERQQGLKDVIYEQAARLQKLLERVDRDAPEIVPELEAVARDPESATKHVNSATVSAQPPQSLCASAGWPGRQPQSQRCTATPWPSLGSHPS